MKINPVMTELSGGYPAFIQDPEHRPRPETVECDDIPFIDLSPSESCDEQSAAAQVGAACRNWGVFQVINHGVPLHVRRNMELVSREFFALPEQEKQKVARDDQLKPSGYFDTELTHNVRDWKQVFEFRTKLQMWNQWPLNPPQMKEVCMQYGGEMEKLAYKLLELIAVSLGLERDRLKGFFKDEEEALTFIRLNLYPPCPIPDRALGVGRHRDDGALTILAQDDVGGLEVKRKADGEWVAVKPMPNAYVVNVGDIIQVWSNGEYESVEHRVRVKSEKERFSTPYFLFPAHGTKVEPLEELVNSQDSPN